MDGSNTMQELLKVVNKKRYREVYKGTKVIKNKVPLISKDYNRWHNRTPIQETGSIEI